MLLATTDAGDSAAAVHADVVGACLHGLHMVAAGSDLCMQSRYGRGSISARDFRGSPAPTLCACSTFAHCCW